MTDTEDDLHAEIMGLETQLAEATERNGNMAVELAAMTLERDSLRREVDALVGAVAKRKCARVFGCPRTDAAPISKCRECWALWAKQQAAKAGKEAGV